MAQTLKRGQPSSKGGCLDFTVGIEDFYYYFIIMHKKRAGGGGGGSGGTCCHNQGHPVFIVLIIPCKGSPHYIHDSLLSYPTNFDYFPCFQSQDIELIWFKIKNSIDTATHLFIPNLGDANSDPLLVHTRAVAMARGIKATLLCAHGPTVLTNPEPCSADFLSAHTTCS